MYQNSRNNLNIRSKFKIRKDKDAKIYEICNRYVVGIESIFPCFFQSFFEYNLLIL